MQGNATIKRDASLDAAKDALRGRVGPLFNKGGLAYVSDADLEDLRRGTNRKH